MEEIQTGLLVIILIGIFMLIVRQSPRKNKLGTTNQEHSVIVDSSALIDGRVIEVARSGFLFSRIIVPSSVLREMQYLADTGDATKRARARHGLDVVKQLQDMTDINVVIYDDGELDSGGVDDRLLVLAKESNGHVLTLDFNLSKVAVAEGVKVLNINQLAQSLRMAYLPGEKRHITLVQKGQDKTQAVGYLEDGTMVVVENASKDIGSSVEVEFIRAIQTQAGKMLFAKKVITLAPEKSTKKITRSTTTKRPSRKSPEDSLVELANK